MRWLFVLLLTSCCFWVFGCVDTEMAGFATDSQDSVSEDAFAASSISIQGLTEISDIDEFGRFAKITAYVDVLDQYKTKLKAPGVFRFELYEFLTRQSDPKGKRVYMWDDFNLVDPVENQCYWQESFRSYEFKLQLSQSLEKDKNYILLATFKTADGKRLSDEFKLGYNPE